jgi:hypothetical protein
MDIIEPAYRTLIAIFSDEKTAGFEHVAAGHEVFLDSILSGSVMDKHLGSSLQNLYGALFDCVETLVNDPSSNPQDIQQVLVFVAKVLGMAPSSKRTFPISYSFG